MVVLKESSNQFNSIVGLWLIIGKKKTMATFCLHLIISYKLCFFSLLIPNKLLPSTAFHPVYFCFINSTSLIFFLPFWTRKLWHTLLFISATVLKSLPILFFSISFGSVIIYNNIFIIILKILQRYSIYSVLFCTTKVS